MVVAVVNGTFVNVGAVSVLVAWGGSERAGLATSLLCPILILPSSITGDTIDNCLAIVGRIGAFGAI